MQERAIKLVGNARLGKANVRYVTIKIRKFAYFVSIGEIRDMKRREKMKTWEMFKELTENPEKEFTRK